MAAAAIEIEEKVRPSPIRFKEKLDVLFIFLLKSSYKGMKQRMKIIEMMLREGTGISNEGVICLFMIMPCCTVKVSSCATQQFMTIVLAKIGRRPINVLVSSTSIGDMFLSNNALSKHLKK